MLRISGWINLPKIQLAIFLGLIAITAIVFGNQPLSIITVSAAIGLTFLFDFLLIRLRKIPPFLLSAAVVSGLIIGLLAFPPLPWYYLVSVCLLAMLSKNFLRARNRHFFNPAAFGLVAAGIIFNQNVSWWGVIFQYLHFDSRSIGMFIMILLPAYVSFYRMRKGKSILSFLTVYTLLQVIIRYASQGILSILSSTLLSPQLLFFSLVMLPEPMTSPNNSRLQLLFGAFVAIAGTWFNFLSGRYMPDTLLVSLLLGNLMFFGLRFKYP